MEEGFPDRSIDVLYNGIELGPRAFRKWTWRDGPRGKLASRFVFRRVKVAHDEGEEREAKENDEARHGGPVPHEAPEDNGGFADDGVGAFQVSVLRYCCRVDGIEVGHGYCTLTLGSTSVVAKSARMAPRAKMTEP